ncbi:pentapeptide repeat-containing protein, partial [uncultured Fibrobacter sp.]|uniref:pentapeptide repeat-containing protein n=1 Tax=uncultured Fibrobacter sp. TaxID=261512 RepID=UPI0025FDF7CF
MGIMTQEELDKIVEQHQHWIKEDCEGWEGMKADLRGADLSGANLSGADLSGADLSEANLS